MNFSNRMWLKEFQNPSDQRTIDCNQTCISMISVIIHTPNIRFATEFPIPPTSSHPSYRETGELIKCSKWGRYGFATPKLWNKYLSRNNRNWWEWENLARIGFCKASNSSAFLLRAGIHLRNTTLSSCKYSYDKIFHLYRW